MSLPKRNSADGRCYWMKPEVQEELQPLFDQCIQDAIDGRITRLDSLWPPVVVSSEGAPFEVWQLLRTWTEAQRAETLDAEKAIAFSENLRRQSRWGEIDHHLLDMLQRELQEKYFIVTGNEDDHFWDREYSLKPGIRAEQVPEPLLRFACYVAVSYKVYGMDFQYARYFTSWEQITPVSFPNPMQNRIIENYCSGVYLSPDQVIQLLKDMEQDPKVLEDLEGLWSNGQIAVLKKALSAAAKSGVGLLEATEVVEPNPISPNESTSYSNLYHCDRDGVYLYIDAVSGQLADAIGKNEG